MDVLKDAAIVDSNIQAYILFISYWGEHLEISYSFLVSGIGNTIGGIS